MASDSTTSDAPEEQTRTETAEAGRGALGSVRARASDGTAALVGGGVMLVMALRALAGTRGRPARRALVGAALVVVGLRQRRATDSGGPRDLPGGSSSATTASRRRSVTSEPGQGPTATGPTEETGDRVEFTDDAEATGTHPAGDETAGDPRTETDDENVEIDISESAMADEASEATGPSPEQSMPASTEGTEPEPTPDEDESGGSVDEDGGEETETIDSDNTEREYTEENTTEGGTAGDDTDEGGTEESS